MYTCEYVHIYTYKYIYMCIYTYMCIYICIYIDMAVAHEVCTCIHSASAPTPLQHTLQPALQHTTQHTMQHTLPNTLQYTLQQYLHALSIRRIRCTRHIPPHTNIPPHPPSWRLRTRTRRLRRNCQGRFTGKISQKSALKLFCTVNLVASWLFRISRRPHTHTRRLWYGRLTGKISHESAGY